MIGTIGSRVIPSSVGESEVGWKLLAKYFVFRETALSLQVVSLHFDESTFV